MKARPWRASAAARCPQLIGYSEADRDVNSVGARLTYQRIVKADRTGIQVLLIESVGEILAVREVLNPGPDRVPELTGALE